jgi:hypothetical protein
LLISKEFLRNIADNINRFIKVWREKNMFKKLMILLLVVCLTFLVGFKTFAADTASLGDKPNESSYTINATFDTYDPFANSDSNQNKLSTDNSNLQYYPHHGSSDHDHDGYSRFDSREIFLLSCLGAMIIFLTSPRYH